MTEPTITCPNCKAEIKLAELLAAPLSIHALDAPVANNRDAAE